MSTLHLHEGMAVWDEDRWNEFAGGAYRSKGAVRRQVTAGAAVTAMQRLAEETRYAGARPVYWISLAMTLAAWLI